MAGVAFAVEGDGVGFATESYAASALYTTLASLAGALSRIRRAKLLTMPKWDDLEPLAYDVVAPLLRALISIEPGGRSGRRHSAAFYSSDVHGPLNPATAHAHAVALQQQQSRARRGSGRNFLRHGGFFSSARAVARVKARTRPIPRRPGPVGRLLRLPQPPLHDARPGCLRT
jgi:hypothetical protein